MRSPTSARARLALAAALTTVGLGSLAGSASAATTTFGYTGNEQTYVVPAGVTTLTVRAIGAAGGVYASANVRGRGGSALARLAVSPGSVLRVRVGGVGSDAANPGTSTPGGFNGGGDGGMLPAGNPEGQSGAGGGGASDVRTGSDLASRLVVAGGGGGGSFRNGGGDAGAASAGAGAGTQTGGGAPNGSFGEGGDGERGGVDGEAGGGGGYYGGGASEDGGGGGSTYLAPSALSGSRDEGPTDAAASVSISTGASATVSPTQLAFGSAGTGTQTASQAVTVTGTDPLVPLTVSGFTVSPAGDFVVTDAGTCANATLADGQSCTARVAFRPQAAGARSATLTPRTNAASTPTVALSGTGVAPSFTLTPASQSVRANDPATVTATARDGASGAASTGTVRFTVTGADPQTQDVTLANGSAPFTYTPARSGRDTVTACFDADGDGAFCEAGEPTANATVTVTPDSATAIFASTARATANAVVDCDLATANRRRQPFEVDYRDAQGVSHAFRASTDGTAYKLSRCTTSPQGQKQIGTVRGTVDGASSFEVSFTAIDGSPAGEPDRLGVQLKRTGASSLLLNQPVAPVTNGNVGFTGS